MKYRRYKQEEKMEIIKIVEGSELGVKPTLKELNIHSSTFYKWYGRYHKYGFDGLAPKERKRSKFWNKIPDKLIDKTVKVALERPELSPREFQINIIGDNGEVLETHNNVLDENFNFSDMAGGNSSK